MPNTHGRRPPNPQKAGASHGRRPSNPQQAQPPRGSRQKPPPPPSRSGRPTVDGCSMAIPVTVALLPYAMVRLAWDSWRSR